MNRHQLDYFIDGLAEGNHVVLAQAITLVESKKQSDQVLADILLDEIIKKEQPSIRIGITGTPGVGKSSFIEGFGNYLIEQGKKVAVLAIDPSSQRTGGSILGDKTRMDTLSKNPRAYIRPSASGSALGGVNNKTREAILLCEAAAFDVIIIETVGVGQSETLVHNMVDFFLLMIQPGSGDDLQGIKKGIMEMADGIVINKADGDQARLAKRSKSDLLNALHLFSASDSGWATQVQLCSALEKSGFEEVWQMIENYAQQMTDRGYFDKNRKDQDVNWFENRVNFSLMQRLSQMTHLNQKRIILTEKIRQNEISVSVATKEMLETLGQLFKA